MCSRDLDSEILDSEASTSKPTSLPLAYHPLSSSIILPSSHPQSLQIYSPASSTLLSELEVSPSNRVSKRDDKPVEVSRVRHVALSSCGLWMATLDARNGETGYPPEIFLKIWAWNEKSSDWTLHSRIDQPHGTSHVTSISFSPRSGADALYVASCGEDGSLKIWRLKSKPRNGKVVSLCHRRKLADSASSCLDSTRFVRLFLLKAPLLQLVY